MSKRAYAADTSVSVQKSRAEVEATLTRYGADAFGYAQDGREVRIQFRMAGRHFRFALVLPDPDSAAIRLANFGARGLQPRTPQAAAAAWEQACRQKWRALALVIKAKLEAVDAGIVSLEDEFLANVVLSDGATVGETIAAEIAENYRIGGPPRLLLGGPG